LNVQSVHCLKGQGLEGDAHCGETVKHRSRVAVDASQPNLRQVHLIQSTLLDELNQQGFEVAPGMLGENLTTEGVDLLQLPRDSLLQFNAGVRLRVTGLRNPCAQIEAFRPGLLRKLVLKDDRGNVLRRAGIMAVVEEGGLIRAGDEFSVTLPEAPHCALERV
jgi:MOSC domain-containing protein YiiM